MKLKTLLLGSAAALLTVGAAQAADLGAEPANYVKICDAFGPGFYYAPGTDTCIKIGGYVQFDVNFANPITVSNSVTSGHMFNTEAAVNVTASSMTEYGPLVGFLNVHASGGSALGSGRPGVAGITPANVDEAWLSLGPLLAGFTWSVYNPTFEPNTGYLWQFTGNNRLNQIRLSWAANGLGLAIAAEDYSIRVPGSVSAMPDIVAALNGSWGNMGLHVGAGWGNHNSTSTLWREWQYPDRSGRACAGRCLGDRCGLFGWRRRVDRLIPRSDQWRRRASTTTRSSAGSTTTLLRRCPPRFRAVTGTAPRWATT